MKPRASSTAAAFPMLVFHLVMLSSSGASVVFFDDFGDGNDNGWQRLDLTAGTAWGPGVFDASSFAYLIESTGEVPAGASGGIHDSLFAVQPSNPIFANGFLQADIISNSLASVDLVLRNAGGNSYFYVADPNKDEIRIAKVTDGGNSAETVASLSPAPFPLVPGEEWTMKAGAVGEVLTLKIWRTGDLEPVGSQLRTTDSQLTFGQFAVGVAVPSSFLEAVQPSATFDNVAFMIPELSSVVLAGLVCAGLVCAGLPGCRGRSDATVH